MMKMAGLFLAVVWVVVQEVPNLKVLMLSGWYSVYRFGGSGSGGGSNGAGY